MARQQLRPGGSWLAVDAPLWSSTGGTSQRDGHGFEGSDVLHSRKMSLVKKVEQV